MKMYSIVFSGFVLSVFFSATEAGNTWGWLDQYSKLCFSQQIQNYLGAFEKSNLKEKNSLSLMSSLLPKNKIPEKQIVWNMLEELITKETVLKGLNIFLSLPYEDVSDEDFFQSMNIAAKEDNWYGTGKPKKFVKNMLRSWCKNEGSPVILLERQNSTHISISQSAINLEDDSTWYIPLNIISGDGHQWKVWLEDDGAPKFIKYEASSSWILVDRKTAGNLRVLYIDNLFSQLVDQLEKNFTAFSALQRECLLEDYEKLSHGHVSISAYLNLTHYIIQETEVSVWNSFLNNHINTQINNKGFESYKKYIQTTVDKALSPLMEDIKLESVSVEGLTKILNEESDSSLRKYLLKKAAFFGTPLALQYGYKLVQDVDTKLNYYGENQPFDFREKHPIVGSLLLKSVNADYFQKLTHDLNGQKYSIIPEVLLAADDPKLFRLCLNEALKEPRVNLSIPYAILTYDKRKVLMSFFEENINSITPEELSKTFGTAIFVSEEEGDQIMKFMDRHPSKFIKYGDEIRKLLKANRVFHEIHNGGIVKDTLEWIRMERIRNINKQ